LNCGQLNHFAHKGLFGWNEREEATWGDASLWTAGVERMQCGCSASLGKF